jgi:ribosome-associated protein
MSNYTNVVITGDYIELNKLLKFEGLVESGAQAKQVIAEGYVLVNNEVATQTRKKIFNADLVEVNGEVLRIISG